MRIDFNYDSTKEQIEAKNTFVKLVTAAGLDKAGFILQPAFKTSFGYKHLGPSSLFISKCPKEVLDLLKFICAELSPMHDSYNFWFKL